MFGHEGKKKMGWDIGKLPGKLIFYNPKNCWIVTKNYRYIQILFAETIALEDWDPMSVVYIKTPGYISSKNIKSHKSGYRVSSR